MYCSIARRLFRAGPRVRRVLTTISKHFRSRQRRSLEVVEFPCRVSKTFRKLRKILEGGTASPVLVSLSKIAETLISCDFAIISRAPVRANNNLRRLKGAALNYRFSKISRLLLTDSFENLEIRTSLWRNETIVMKCWASVRNWQAINRPKYTLTIKYLEYNGIEVLRDLEIHFQLISNSDWRSLIQNYATYSEAIRRTSRPRRHWCPSDWFR